MPKATNEPIAIIGGGAWGLSTALHLRNAGYSDIHVFDRSSSIPSKHSAAYDLNKIVRAEYEDDFYTALGLEAIDEWKTPLFGPHYHQTGYIVATSANAPQKAVESLSRARASVSGHPNFAPGLRPLDTTEQFRDCVWQFSGPMTGFRGYFNRLAGYAHSSNALAGIYEHLLRLGGVRFHLGPVEGRVAELTYSDHGSQSPRRCSGFITVDGQEHRARTTIVALGAHAGSLLPELGHSIVARSWSVAHIRLTKMETDFLRGIPTTNVRDLGFFFEPDPATQLFKLCPMGAGYTNRTRANPNTSDNRSLAPEDGLPSTLHNYIPPHDEAKLRTLLHETIPWLADRPFVDKRLCWIADTRDSEYVIDFVPGTNQSLAVLSGDSGHGFKMMPIVGKWVVDLLSEGRQRLARWQWRDETQSNSDWGDEVSWRIGQSRDIRELLVEKEQNDLVDAEQTGKLKARL